VPEAQPVAAKAASTECTRCAVEVENRYEYQVMVFDTRSGTGVGEVPLLGKAEGFKTVMIYTAGRPFQGLSAVKDEGQRLTVSGAVKCRQEAVRAGSTANYRYVCGR
jgi:hypothetical protein